MTKLKSSTEVIERPNDKTIRMLKKWKAINNWTFERYLEAGRSERNQQRIPQKNNKNITDKPL